MRNARQFIAATVGGMLVTAAAALLLSSAAMAAPATATTNVNVRSGPGTNFGVIGTLRTGDRVEVGEQQGGFCYVDYTGRSGWVSCSFLAIGAGPRPGPAPAPGNPSVNFGINVPGGPSINFGVGNNPPPPPPGPGPRPPRPGFPPPPPPVDDYVAEVCFYDATRFRGDSFCMEEGESIRDLSRVFRGRWNDEISSIENPDGLRVTVCYDANYRDCRDYTTSASTIRGGLDKEISSIRVR